MTRTERTRPIDAMVCVGKVAFDMLACSGQEENVTVARGEQPSIHAVPGRPSVGGVVYQFLKFLLGGHAPIVAPVGRGRIVTRFQDGQFRS